jgi:hypothetical protein
MVMEAGHRVQPPRNEGIIADESDGFQYHLAGALRGPFGILFQKDGANQANEGLFGQEDEMINRRRSCAVVAVISAMDHKPAARVF